MAHPRFDELKRPDETGLPLSWGVWGADDQIGTLNNITPEVVIAAARLVTAGRRFPLDLPLHEPFSHLGPDAHRLRSAPRQTLFKSTYAGLLVRDDKVDNLFLQGSTQWDGLTHIGDPRHGFYNHTRDEEITQASNTRNGVEQFSAFGIVTRGVLIDLPRHFAATGRAWEPVGGGIADADDLAACLAGQRTTLEPGDVLLVRTGWVGRFLGESSDAERDRLFRARDYSGLSGGEDMWRFLWDHRVAAVASDSVTVEVWPLAENRPSLHLAIARLGLVLGEMFALDAFAEHCAASGDYTGMFVSSPLNIRGGTGAPPNAMIVR
jgi:kynurenine formamidase